MLWIVGFGSGRWVCREHTLRHASFQTHQRVWLLRNCMQHTSVCFISTENWSWLLLPLQCFILKDKTCSTGPGLVSFPTRLSKSGLGQWRTNHLLDKERWRLKECTVIRTVAISETCSQNWRDLEGLNGRIRLFKRHQTSRCKHKRCRHSRYCF